MHKPLPLVLVVMLSAAALAGCLGEDDAPDLDNDPSDDGDASTGSIEGRVLTKDLQEIAGARAQLVDGGELVDEAESDEQGNYKITGIEPGNYRIQMSAACCHQEARAVTVVAGEVTKVDIQLAPFTDADLEEPYVDELQWSGMLSCGVGSPVVTSAPCSLVDPNDDFLHEWKLLPGVEDVVVGVVWDPAGGVAGENLFIAAENDGCGALSCSQSYATAEGPSPLLFRLNNPSGEYAFSEVEDARDMQFRVFPSFEPDVYYQQPFTVYYHIFYFEGADEDYTPIPDL